MINRIFFVFILVSFLTLILFSCANEVRPTGGPKDTIPPQLVSSFPVTKSLNFNGNSVIIEFNEFIKTDKLNTQLLITPRVESEYKVKAGSRKIELQFEEDNPFQPNTTYTFNFQTSIKDLTESNPWEDPKIVFSTGSELDSLYLEGYVYDLLSKKPAKNAVVSIYQAKDTLNALTGKPMYFTFTDENGYFILENLVSNNYRIYSFNDKNNNLVIDASSESYGFLSDTLYLESPISNLELNLISLNVNDIRLVSSRPVRYYFDISYNKSLREFNLSSIENEVELYSNFQDQNKKIRIYNTFSLVDSLQTNVTVKDSLENTLTDTVYVKFQKSTLPPENFSQSVIPTNNKPVPQNFSGKITFNKPIIQVNYDSLFFLYDSITTQPLTPDDITFNKNRDIAYINRQLNLELLNTGEIFNFYASAGSFISADQDSSKTISYQYKLLDPVNFGTIKGEIVNSTKPSIIQLLSNSFAVEMETKTQNKFQFTNVPPGSYYLRIMVDENQNGEWDPGNILANKTPEPVVFYRNEQGDLETLSIKANWEITDIKVNLP